jgi:hypothetical protein
MADERSSAPLCECLLEAASKQCGQAIDFVCRQWRLRRDQHFGQQRDQRIGERADWQCAVAVGRCYVRERDEHGVMQRVRDLHIIKFATPWARRFLDRYRWGQAGSLVRLPSSPL